MTAGDYLNSISTVTDVAAHIHLLNIETGTGSGETIYVSRLQVAVQNNSVPVSILDPSYIYVTPQVLENKVKVVSGKIGVAIVPSAVKISIKGCDGG